MLKGYLVMVLVEVVQTVTKHKKYIEESYLRDYVSYNATVGNYNYNF